MIRAILILGALAIGLVACSGDETRTSTPTLTGPTTIEQNAPCSIVVVIFGAPQEVRGAVGSTITVGNTTITFGPDCASTVTETAPAPVT
jgi:hypothetical protein